jgi:hypothetical protein
MGGTAQIALRFGNQGKAPAIGSGEARQGGRKGVQVLRWPAGWPSPAYSFIHASRGERMSNAMMSKGHQCLNRDMSCQQ